MDAQKHTTKRIQADHSQKPLALHVTRFYVQVCLGPFAFFNVDCGRQEVGLRGRSFTNHEEAKFLFTILNYLFDKHKPEEIGTVGIISPYKAQVLCCGL